MLPRPMPRHRRFHAEASYNHFQQDPALRMVERSSHPTADGYLQKTRPVSDAKIWRSPFVRRRNQYDI
jgi:hypothetical protein